MVSRQENNARRVAALDERAEALGLKRGMGVADAQVMHPGIEVVEDEPEADARLLGGLADWCDRYTPLVARDGADGLFLDITGCVHLFGGEQSMLDDALARFLRQGFFARAAIASTAGTAWAAARFSGRAIVPPGGEKDLLNPLPIAALRIERRTRELLEGVGLRTAGAVMAAPRAPLARRFGRELLMRLDQALGAIDEPLSPQLPVPALSVERHLLEPVVSADEIERLVALLAGTLRRDLERRGEGARSVELHLFRVDGHVCRISTGTSRPLRDPLWLQRLFRERLIALENHMDAGYGFDLVRLCVPATAPFPLEQAHLIDRAGEAEADLALFTDRVRARLGEAAISKPCLVESHLPERAAPLVTIAQAAGREGGGNPSSRHRRSLERPIRLFERPEPVDVTLVEVPEGPPAGFRWRRTHHRVERSEGPERIAPEWWLQNMPEIEPEEGDDPDEARKQATARKTVHLTRDYFRVEDTQGRRYWLYRQGLYDAAQPPRWFMHGVFT